MKIFCGPSDLTARFSSNSLVLSLPSQTFLALRKSLTPKSHSGSEKSAFVPYAKSGLVRIMSGVNRLVCFFALLFLSSVSNWQTSLLLWRTPTAQDGRAPLAPNFPN